MLNNCNVTTIDPFVFVGRNMAAFLTNAPLESKITVLARAIFFGAFTYLSFLGYKHFFAIVLAPILPVSIGMALSTLFLETTVWGYRNRRVNSELSQFVSS